MTSPDARYSDLTARTDAPPGSSWGLFGDDDDVGTVNFLTPDRVRHAATLVRSGRVFPLDLPLGSLDPPPAGFRGAMTHTITGDFPGSDFRDDKLDDFYPQASSQIDGLRHFRHWEHGFYNGVPDEEIHPGNARIGIGKVADHGIVGRGVLLDLARHFQSAGDPVDVTTARRFTPTDLEAVAEAQGVEFHPGDILLLRTGFARDFVARSPEERAKLTAPGLDQSEEMVAWLWDHRFSVLAGDVLALEAVPPSPDSPFLSQAERDGQTTVFTGFMHRVLIPLLGFTVGELWDLELLAEDCASDQTYDCMIVSVPLNIVGGVGSTANAVAIR